MIYVNILLTGGAGFIGAHLARRLCAAGHGVTVLDDLSSGQPDRLRGLPVRLLQGDVRDPACVREALRGADAVFHLAAVVGVPHAMARRWDSLTTNLLGTARLLEAARERSTPVVVASSSAIYGKSPRVPVGEEDDVLLGNTHRPGWTYAYAKLGEEALARAAAAEWGLPVKIVRFFNVIGPGQTGRYGMVVPRFVRWALRGEPLRVYGDGSQTRTFVHVEDAVDAALLVWERGAWGAAYNVGGEEEVSILELARRVLRVTGSRSPIVLVPYAEAVGPDFEDVPRRRPALDRVRALGYRPRRSLDETLRAVADWLQGEPP